MKAISLLAVAGLIAGVGHIAYADTNPLTDLNTTSIGEDNESNGDATSGGD